MIGRWSSASRRWPNLASAASTSGRGGSSRWPTWRRSAGATVPVLWDKATNTIVSNESAEIIRMFNSAFDDDMGSLADPNDNELTLRTWAESLEMAVQHGVEHLFLFSNQVDFVNGQTWTRRLSSNFTPAEQYANTLRQTERILKLVEQTPIRVWVESLNEFHIKGGILVNEHHLAADWVKHFKHPQMNMVFDCYHQQRQAGNLIWGLEQYAGLYDAVHVGAAEIERLRDQRHAGRRHETEAVLDRV
ncbi:MAG TPA: TIM barrel protein, partial [Anaerolineales bacterium]|nr:TIM barrel protein [Anaerolineales bacterium]